MSRSAGSAYPWPTDDEHVGGLNRLIRRSDVDPPLLLPMSDEQMRELDRRERQELIAEGLLRVDPPGHTHPGCGHACASGECWVMAGAKDYLCPGCARRLGVW